MTAPGTHIFCSNIRSGAANLFFQLSTLLPLFNEGSYRAKRTEMTPWAGVVKKMHLNRKHLCCKTQYNSTTISITVYVKLHFFYKNNFIRTVRLKLGKK